MMTKDQERGVLRQIVELIDSTGEGSYIKTAFTGCVRDAERNIDEDAAYSWHDRAQSAERKAGEAARELLAVKEALKRRENYIRYWQSETEAAGREYAQATKEAEEAKAEAEALRQEVTELKAKLYDFMIKG